MTTTHVTFIHGIANKPAPDQLKRIWLDALSVDQDASNGFDLEGEGVTTSFVYWADMFHKNHIPAGDYESKKDELASSAPDDTELEEDEWMLRMQIHFPVGDDDPYVDPEVSETTELYERIPIPWFIKKKVMKRFLKEVYAYLFNKKAKYGDFRVRDRIRELVVKDLEKNDADRNIIVSHSQGTVIAYDVLNNVDECKSIHGLMTLGSPLGIDEVQDKLELENNNAFPKKLIGDWYNIYDPFDVVSRLDPILANDYKKNGNKLINDIKESNWGKWRHSATKYYKGEKLRQALRALTDRIEK